MRLLIESRKLTIELAATKHTTADRPAAETFASDTATRKSQVDRFDTEFVSFSADDKDSTSTSNTSVYQYSQLPRRKSIHRRIGRLFLRISRMCSDEQCSAYAYQYGGGASELPAGGLPIEGSTSLYEMPGTFPRVELEGSDIQEPATRCHLTNMIYIPEHLRDYYKANRNATLRRAAPMSVANLSQLPRLEVPQSQHCVPRLISDHSPLTPSSISPITPVLNTKGEHKQHSNSYLYLDAISPCTIPKQKQLFANYGSWGYHTQLSPATPFTASSYRSSNATTPISAQSSSASSSFQPWSQMKTRQPPPTYSQAYSPMNYNESTGDAMVAEATPWQTNVNVQPHSFTNIIPTFQMQDYRSNDHIISRPRDPSSQAQSCFEKSSQLDTLQLHSTPLQSSQKYNDPPPAYVPFVPDPQPAPTNSQGDPPAVCQQCGKIFTGKYGPGNCRRHVQQTHGSIFDRPIHICKVCMKTYNRADALRKHQWKKHRQEDARPQKRRK